MEEIKIDFASLDAEELQKEYVLLHGRYQELQRESEADAQRIHELTLSLKVANSTAKDLSDELESITSSETTDDSHSKTYAEQEERLRRLGARYATLQQDYDTLTEENVQMRSDLEAARTKIQAQLSAVPLVEATELSDVNVERLNHLEQENLELLQQLKEFQVTNTINIAQREKNIEILRDQVNCLDENLQSKRNELEERTQLLESAQEQLAEANAKLAMITTAPDEDDSRKGNSLFAEVDDQRQAMKQLLVAQKKSYLQMKKIYNESEHEIRRLKRENIAMHTELHACSSIFCNADKTYQDKLNERIRNLLNQNEDYERKLSWTQARLKELANGKGVLWLDSMLNFCKKETDDLKQQLHSVRIQNATLEEQLRNVRQDMARWRFEALKSRCILIDREDRLSEHKIAFKTVRDMEFRITQTQQEAAVPRIATDVTAATAKTLIQTSSNDKVKQEVFTATPQKHIESNSTNATNDTMPTIKAEFEIPHENKENVMHCREQLSEPLKSSTASPLSTKQLPPPTPLRENNKGRPKSPSSPFIKLKSFALESSNFESTSPLPGRSILTKNRDIFKTKETQKNVQFSSNNANVLGRPETIIIEDDAREKVDVPKTTTTIKQKRTKSNIIVRRVVVSSVKKENS